MSQRPDTDKAKGKDIKPEIKLYFVSGIFVFYIINIFGLLVSVAAFKYLGGWSKLFFLLGALATLNVTAGYLTLRFSERVTEE